MKNRRILYLCVIFILLTVLLCACSAESPEPAAPVSTEPPELLPTVYISELMASNKSTLRDEKGLFPVGSVCRRPFAESERTPAWRR